MKKSGKRHCYGLNYVPQNPLIEAKLPVPQNVTVFGAKPFKGGIKFKRGCQGGPQSNLTGVLKGRGYLDTDTRVTVSTVKKPCEDTARGQLSISQSGTSKETKPANTLILDFHAPKQ